tara:strand:+ start:3201 stop:3500 length:300 start_codon:yes stop_codon:yes gene_type:complete
MLKIDSVVLEFNPLILFIFFLKLLFSNNNIFKLCVVKRNNTIDISKIIFFIGLKLRFFEIADKLRYTTFSAMTFGGDSSFWVKLRITKKPTSSIKLPTS